MPGVAQVQDKSQGAMSTGLQGLQAYGAVNGIMNSNAQTDAMQRRLKMLQASQPGSQAPDDGSGQGGGY